MAEFTRASGVRVRTAPMLTIGEPEPPGPGSRRRGAASQGLGDAETVSADSVAVGLADVLDLVDVIPVVPTVEPTSVSGRRSRSAPSVPGRSSVELDLDVAEGDSAVVLVEQDGVYQWVIGTEVDVAPAAGRRRGEPVARTLHFQIEAHARSDRRRSTLRRGFVSDLVLRPMRAFVFRFAAGVVVGQVVRRLERDIRDGLVRILDHDPAGWEDIQPNDVSLPNDRAARVLLLVHGTFSSTRGGLAGLAATPHGRAFLDRAFEVYDEVLGYDHRTLSEDPVENAEQIASALTRLVGDRPAAHVDIVCHSRGALVSRALVEIVLPHLDPAPARIDRVVMVAGPNGGTALANPANWKGFVDLYTNLAVAGTRGLAAFAPPAATVALVTREVLKGVATLVKAIAVSAVDVGRAPGLAAMDPGGAFVAELNRTQPLQPAPGVTDYYAVTSDFEVTLADPGTVPERLKRVLADALADAVMDRQNDLVVDVPSMTYVDPHVYGYVSEVYDFGTNPRVFHTVYFLEERTVEVLRRWLGMDRPDAYGGGGLLPPGVRHVKPGTVIDGLPALVEQDVLRVDAGWPLARVRRAMERDSCAYVVVRREEPGTTETYHYAFRPDELRDVTAFASDDERLEDMGVLHETGASAEQEPGAVDRLSGIDSFAPWTRRAVVLDDGVVRGVVPHVTDGPLAMAERPGEVGPRPAAPPAPPSAPSRRPRRAHALPDVFHYDAPPSERPQRARRSPAREARQPSEVQLPPPAPEPVASTAPPHHVRGEMPSAVVVGSTADVLVHITTEEIVAAAARAVAAGVTVDIDPARKLVVTMVPRSGVMAVGDWQASIDPLAPGGAAVILFQVQGVEPGPAEVWVIVRQGPQSLLTLTLRATVTATAGGPVLRAMEEAIVEPPAPSACQRRTLRIYETTAPSGELMLKFDLEMRDLGVYEHADSQPISGNRDDYVSALYASIEHGWVGSRGGVAVFTRRLRGIGAQILRELVPPAIRDPLWEHRDKLDRIEVVSTEPQIPWEIVHLMPPGQGRALPDEEQFLGMKGLVRWIHGAGVAAPKVRLDDVVGVVPRYPDGSGWELPATEGEWEFLSRELAASRLDATLTDVLAAISEPGGFHVFHFAGHGEAESNRIAHAALLMEDGVADGGRWRPDRLTSTDVESDCRLWPADGGVRPMVVLNACQVGRSGYQLTDLGGFARAFLLGGAGLFVGSLWAVGDEPASTFAQALYARLRAGDELSEAATAAREASRAADDATWLAYVVYGDPCAALTSG